MTTESMLFILFFLLAGVLVFCVLWAFYLTKSLPSALEDLLEDNYSSAKKGSSFEIFH